MTRATVSIPYAPSRVIVNLTWDDYCLLARRATLTVAGPADRQGQR